MKILYLILFISSCSLVDSNNAKITYDYIQSKKPIHRILIEELVVTKPIGTSGIPIADNVLNPLECIFDDGTKPKNRIYFHQKMSGYHWRYSYTFYFGTVDSLKNPSIKQQSEILKKLAPIDSSKRGVFDTLPVKFKINTWYPASGMELIDQGVYNFLF